MNNNFWLIANVYVLALLLITGPVKAQWSMSELNLSHKYDPEAEIRLYCQPAIKSDSLHLYIGLQINQDKPQLNDYSFDIFQTSSLTEKLTNPTPKTVIDSTFINRSANRYGLKFSFKNTNSQWVTIRVFSKFSGYHFYYEYPISAINNPDFLFYKGNKICLEPYITAGNFYSNKQLTGFYYKHEFKNALPPMVTTAPLPEKAITVDSVFQWSADSTHKLKGEGLYFFQEDTTQMAGRGFLLTHKYFPSPATLSQLIEPLVYITTRAEKKRLDGITEKKDFDKFWLDLTNSTERAKKIIREFYSRVEHANSMFTTFKPGWKTDMGMIYIIFGLPDEVIKSDKEEVWVYLDNTRIPNTKFSFIKANNVFSSSHYVLIRDKKYDDVWFRAVDLWRKSRF